MDRRREFEQTVQRAVDQDGLLARGTRVLVAVSGGPDSLALLAVLHALSPPERLDLRLAVAHLNHRWRGVESDRDALVVAAVARSLGLECFVGDAEGVLAGSRGNGEARARTARLAFLRRVADAWRADAIALGHTRDDQAETVLLRLARGGGPASLAAMHPQRADGIVRPLLGTSRASTHAYLAARGLRAVRDRSNDDERHLRNVVRRRVLPALERELTPAIGLRLARLARELRVEAHLAEQTIERLLAEARHAELPLALLERAGPGAARLLHAWISRFDVRPSARQVEAVLGVARSADPGGRADLGRGVLVRRAYGALLLERFPGPSAAAGEAAVTLSIPAAVTLPIPGEARFPGGWRLTGELAKADVPQVIESPGEAAPWQLDVDPSRVGDSVVLRAPRAGDRIRLPGGRRKLSDVLIDARVPRAERRSLVVVEDGEEILWIPGVIASVVAAAPGRSGARVHLRAEREVCRHFSPVITTREPGL